MVESVVCCGEQSPQVSLHCLSTHDPVLLRRSERRPKQEDSRSTNDWKIFCALRHSCGRFTGSGLLGMLVPRTLYGCASGSAVSDRSEVWGPNAVALAAKAAL